MEEKKELGRIYIEFLPGTSLEEALEEASFLARKYHCVVSFRFNDLEIRILKH